MQKTIRSTWGFQGLSIFSFIDISAPFAFLARVSSDFLPFCVFCAFCGYFPYPFTAIIGGQESPPSFFKSVLIRVIRGLFLIHVSKFSLESVKEKPLFAFRFYQMGERCNFPGKTSLLHSHQKPPCLKFISFFCFLPSPRFLATNITVPRWIVLPKRSPTALS